MAHFRYGSFLSLRSCQQPPPPDLPEIRSPPLRQSAPGRPAHAQPGLAKCAPRIPPTFRYCSRLGISGGSSCPREDHPSEYGFPQKMIIWGFEVNRTSSLAMRGGQAGPAEGGRKSLNQLWYPALVRPFLLFEKMSEVRTLTSFYLTKNYHRWVTFYLFENDH